MKRIVYVLILAVLSLLLATPLVFAQSTQVTQTIQEVEQETQGIRGLTEKEPIDVRFMTTKELEQMLLDDLNKEYTPEEWARDEDLLKLMGFLKENDSYYDIMLGLYTEQIAGFYDPDEKYLALISEDKKMSAMDRMNLSHEITHALQDQYYHLDQPPYETHDSTNYDADFAATCLVEGDATLTMYQYEETFTSEDYADLTKESGNVESAKFDAAPKYIQDSLLFPYQQGMVFANRLYDRNSFATIDNAYSNPPVSSEQVMHPEKYLAREMPMQVNCPDISSSLGEGWELADTNVMGEFDIQELLMTELRTTDADKGAAGWGGCQYRLYTNPDTGKNLVSIDIKWDNEAEAKEFAGLYEEYVDKRFGLDKGSYAMDNGWAVWDTGKSGSAALSLKGNETFVVLSTDKNAVNNAYTALGASGGNLGGVLESQPELEGRADKRTSSSNWLVFAVVLGLLVLGLVIVVVFLVINRKERAAQAVVYPAYRQQPPWPPQPPYPPYTGGPGGGLGGPGGGSAQAWPGQPDQAWLPAQPPWPPPQPPGLQYPQQQVWPPQPPLAPQAPEPGEGPSSQDEGPVEYS